MDSSIYIFNYITTNNLNGKQYVGMHITKDLSDGYIGSGRTAFIPAVKKYGKENFTREILCFCPDASIAFYNEGIYIDEYNTLSPYGYNVSPKGGMKGKGSVSDDTKLKISITLTGRKGKPSKYKGVPRSEVTKEKCRIGNLGKKRSIESRKKMSESKLGNKNREGHLHTEKTKQKIRETKTGVKIGKNRKKKILSKEHKQNMRHPHRKKS